MATPLDKPQQAPTGPTAKQIRDSFEAPTIWEDPEESTGLDRTPLGWPARPTSSQNSEQRSEFAQLRAVS